MNINPLHLFIAIGGLIVLLMFVPRIALIIAFGVGLWYLVTQVAAFYNKNDKDSDNETKL